jgi:dTMP kinase
MARGKFITLEGGEGAGKSTQAKILAEFLRTKGHEVALTREVGGPPSAEEIRELWLGKGEDHWDPLTEVLLISAARREHLAKTIWPALERGNWVISDRFADSTRAYQGIGLGIGLETVDHFYQHIAGKFEPDLTLLLDLPVEAGLARMKARKGQDDRYQQKDPAFHRKLREAYLMLAEKYPTRIKVIDASSDAETTAKDVQDAIKELKP